MLKGNLQSAQSLPNLKRIKSEAMAETDYAKDAIQDLKLRSKNEKTALGDSIFIQKIDLDPFSVHLFEYECMRVLRDVQQKGDFVILHFDATGCILKSPTENPLLHHVLLLQVKSHETNKTAVSLNLAELITEDNTSFNVEYFLNHFRAKFNLTYPNTKIASAIVTDKSFANINAIVKSQNLMTLRKYLSSMYEIFAQSSFNKLSNFVLVFLCSGHQAKNWKKDVKRFYGRGLVNSDVNYLCALIGHLMNIREKTEFNAYIQALFIVLCSRRTDEIFMNALEIIQKSAKDLEKLQADFNAIDVTDYTPIEDEEQGKFDDEITAIYKSSEFYKEYMKMVLNTRVDQDETCPIDNRFYNKKYAEDFVKRNVSYLPMWSAIFTAYGRKEYSRPNNGAIEGYFQSAKLHVDENRQLPKRGSVKVGRYVDALKKNIQHQLERIALKIPDRHLSRKSYKFSSSPSQRSKSASEAELEKWKGKAKKGSGIFASTTIMINRSGKKNILSFFYHLTLFFPAQLQSQCASGSGDKIL